MADSRSRDSGSPKSPLHGLGRGGPLAASGATANGDVRHKLLPLLSPPLPGSSPSSSLAMFPMPPRVESGASATPKPHLPLGVFPRPPPSHRAREAAREAPQASEPGRVRQTGEMLRTIMLKHQGLPKARLSPHSPLPGRALPSQRSLGEVIPLRKPPPPEGPRPMKPKRPPYVNLEPYQRNYRALPSGHPGFKKNDGSSSSGGSSLSLPGLVSPPGPPRPPSKPSSLPRQRVSFHPEDNQDTYDDIESLERSGSWNDNSSSHMEGDSDDSEVYEVIDETQLEMKSSNKKTQEMKRQQEQEKKDQKERQKRENETRKRFRLQGEIEVLHIARVRHDWHGGKLDLSVRQGESVEILRLKDNPGGKWLARTLTGNYGYISNACVDIDYEEVKRKALQSRGTDTSQLLPPPPPDPPQTDDIYYDVESTDHVDSSTHQEEEDDYDDVQAMPQDFPPPPAEICLDPKMEKELRKRFKFEGPLRVLYIMMVDPNGSIKRRGGKDLAVVPGEILDVIQLTNDTKALCRNQYGKYGYVSRALLLQMEGDVYDDVDHFNDVYDNDSIH